MHQFKDAQFWDYACDGVARIQEEAMSQHLKQLTNEIEILHQMLNEKDLAGNPEAEDSKSNSIKALEEDLAALRHQRDGGNNWRNELPQISLQLLARMQSLEAQLRSRGLEIHSVERAALMSSFWETVRPHVWDITGLITDDEACKVATVGSAAQPSTTVSETQQPVTSANSPEAQQQNAPEADDEDCYIKHAAEDGSEFARALLAQKAAKEVAAPKEANLVTESPRDRELREAAERLSLLLNHDSKGTVLRVETRGENPPILPRVSFLDA